MEELFTFEDAFAAGRDVRADQVTDVEVISVCVDAGRQQDKGW
jgi:hypothetical protein